MSGPSGGAGAPAGADGSAAASADRRLRGRLATVLKVLVAVAILAFVATRIPWSDQLIWRGEGEARVEGRIEGDWKQAAIVFRPGESASLEGLPAELRARVVEGRTLERGQALDWQPGLPRVFGEVRPAGLAAALAFLFLGVFLTATRWWRLLTAAEVRATWFATLRLTSLGFFFNIVVPGLTGGDLIKAVLVARENPGRRAAAVVSVFVDRFVGLFTLVGLGAVVILVVGGDFAPLRTPVLLLMAGGVLGALVYTSRPLRRLVRFDGVVARLPMAASIQRLDEAVLIYSRHKLALATAVLISAVNHLTAIAGILFLGRAFGDVLLGFWEYVALVSVGNTASSLPIAPGGWGWGEAIYGYLFERLGASATIGVAVSVSYRLCLMVIGLVGGLFLLVPGTRAEIAEIEQMEQGAA